MLRNLDLLASIKEFGYTHAAYIKYNILKQTSIIHKQHQQPKTRICTLLFSINVKECRVIVVKYNVNWASCNVNLLIDFSYYFLGNVFVSIKISHNLSLDTIILKVKTDKKSCKHG